MQIGPYKLSNHLILAPMAGITDRPYRQLCKKLGAGLAVSEMVTSNTRLWNSAKSRRRLDHKGEQEPRIVQIAGADPDMMANAARQSVELGAQIIDINMGCPAKKVCKLMAGSALLADESLVERILEAVVNAVKVPVTLKIRTGIDPTRRNGVAIARIAEAIGIQALAIHGRTRACGFQGTAEYDTIRTIKNAVKLPVIANGDIDSAEKAAQVLEATTADALMIGRAAQGNPWIFKEIDYYLNTGKLLSPLTHDEIKDTMLEHLENLYDFYGKSAGVCIARKHVGWYVKKNHPNADKFSQIFNHLDCANLQLRMVREFLDNPLNAGSLAA